MTSNDKWALPLATKLIKKSGKLVTYRKVVEGSYDPITDTQTVSSTTDYPIKALINNPTENVSVMNNSEVKGLITTTSLVLMIDGQSITFKIETTDTVTIDGVSYKIDYPLPSYSGELIAYYNLLVSA